MKYFAQNSVKIVNQKMTLYDEIAAIVKAISDGDDKYWNGNGYFGVLDQQAVIAAIMAAVVKHDGEEVLEVFGAA